MFKLLREKQELRSTLRWARDSTRHAYRPWQARTNKKEKIAKQRQLRLLLPDWFVVSCSCGYSKLTAMEISELIIAP
jgi:hypothetical protein